MAASEKDIILHIIHELLKLKDQLRAEEGKKQRKPDQIDTTGELKEKRKEFLLQLEEIAERNESAFKEALQELGTNTVSNFYVFLDRLKKDYEFRISLKTFTKQEFNSRKKKDEGGGKSKGSSRKKTAKGKEAVLTPEEDIVSKFLQSNNITEVVLGKEKFIIDHKDESVISTAVKSIIQYFGFYNMKMARNKNLLLSFLDPKHLIKDEKLVDFLLSSGKKQDNLQHLSFPYLIYFSKPGEDGRFFLKDNFDEAMLHRFYYIIFHAIIFFIMVDTKITINVGAISVLRRILLSLDAVSSIEFDDKKRKAIKESIFGSSKEEFSPSLVYDSAIRDEEIDKFLTEEGMRLEAKETLIEVKALAKQVVAFMNSQEEGLIVLGVPEEKHGYDDGVLMPSHATGFSYEQCESKVSELKKYIIENIGIINSGKKFDFDQTVFSVIVPLKNIRTKDRADNLDNNYCLLLMIKNQDYLSYLRLPTPSDGQSQAIAVYVRDYCNKTIESSQAEDEKILEYFLYKEFLTKERSSPEIKVLYKANRFFDYFCNWFKEDKEDKEDDTGKYRRKVISIYYLAKIHKKMSADLDGSNNFMLYDNLLRLLEEFNKKTHPQDKVNHLIKSLYANIIAHFIPNEEILKELKRALREDGYIPPKMRQHMAKGDYGMSIAIGGQPQGSACSSSFFQSDLIVEEVALREEGYDLINRIWGEELDKQCLQKEKDKLKSASGEELRALVGRLRDCLRANPSKGALGF